VYDLNITCLNNAKHGIKCVLLLWLFISCIVFIHRLFIFIRRSLKTMSCPHLASTRKISLEDMNNRQQVGFDVFKFNK
jgi:hypothetical protein